MDVTLPASGGLPTLRVGDVENRNATTSWLIDSLWLTAAVGLIGAQPKSCKTWLGLDMAVSVASGTPCLGRFPVALPGPTLVFLAEDNLEQLRRRVEGIARSRNLSVSSLDLSVITSPVIRLDTAVDQERLTETVSALRPQLLLLDPLVRLHRLDENNARDISGLLGFLRELQRRFAMSIVLTHHASKRSSARPGQALRGSSDLHAFGDSNIYLSRHDDEVELTVEHRSAPPIAPFRFHLVGGDDRTHIALLDDNAKQAVREDSLKERIIEALKADEQPILRGSLRHRLRINNQRLGEALAELIDAGTLTSSARGLSLKI
jgi:hypothetical protein